MHIVKQEEISNQEIHELMEVCKHLEWSDVCIAMNIYEKTHSILTLTTNKDERTNGASALAHVMAYGYRLGVQAERQKQRAKQSHNEV